jgi:type I restriction enzyme R subunit
MNESDTRLHKIDPQLKAAGWGVADGSYVTTEYAFTRGKVSKTVKGKPKKADYVLIYRNVKLAIVEAKSDEVGYKEGIAQAKDYASDLDIRFTYAADGDHIYEIDRDPQHGGEREVSGFPTPQELWQRQFGKADYWRDKLRTEPFYQDGEKRLRYYQEAAVNRVLDAIARGEKRILLTLATGTGKTIIAFHIAWKLFQTRWNVAGTNTRPKVLFLTDRNILADQAFNKFGGFPADALVRIRPESVRKHGEVPTNGSIFFTIFQTFMSGETPNFGQYPQDFFDLIIIDECHRGGARDESNWRGIMDYFNTAVQLGLTATPRVDMNANTYIYFSYHAYEYSLKQGIDDGFLTPFRHFNMKSTIDEYHYTPDDIVTEGKVDYNKTYTEEDFYHGDIVIKERDRGRVRQFMDNMGSPDEKTIVFCANQEHAATIRDMINQYHQEQTGNYNSDYCVRVTANDGEKGDEFLCEFEDNEKVVPTILTTSEKLSTGVDALNVRNIVLMRPVDSMIEFKQIIGRGTRLYDGKYFFTVFDFVKAYEHFSQPAWDGEAVCPVCGNNPCTCKKPGGGGGGGEGGEGGEGGGGHKPPRQKVVIQLSDGKKRSIQYQTEMMFWSRDGKPVAAEDFIREMFGEMPAFYSSIDDLQQQWADPARREVLLDKLSKAGYGVDVLKQIRHIINADNADLLDVLEYVSYAVSPIERKKRAEKARPFADTLTPSQKSFVDYVIDAYIANGVKELSRQNLSGLIQQKFRDVSTGIYKLGGIEAARQVYSNFQKQLYLP